MASMTRAQCLVALVVALVMLLCCFLELAAAAGRSSALEERQEVRSLLRQLNKPPLATIQSPDGDIIDCVHISKQPAFDHPMLKNHTIQMWPSYHPQGLDLDSSITSRPFTQTWQQNGKCPENTIPIRRTQEEDVLRARSVSCYGKKRPNYIDNSEQSVTKGHQYGIASTPANDTSLYYGTQATFNLWQPEVETPKDFSLSQLWITSGSYQTNDLNTIETGWQVFPGLYNDSSPRLFIYWTRDAYNSTGCYNLCPGFVQTNNEIVIGGSISQLSPISTYGGPQYDITILVWKDPKGGNWWLQVGNNVLGYWPSSIFTNLADSATSVQWGGEMESPDVRASTTQMGSGHFPEEGFGKASYIRNIQVVDSSNTLQSPSGLDLTATLPNCYNVQNGGVGTNFGTYIYYGGPGRNPNCQ
ncbi:hypothetical protein U9M48_000633 [Paspalum notatum var. saurae]|uniref:Neprosin PEP catalytic domain-containing protein n=1 Tax=Paspalum notatum var. saurae TaxID=547442 RepID=A0AAQ3PF10_PASNO